MNNALYTYQPYQYPQPQTKMDWVAGIEAAKAYYVGPGSSAFLFDSEENSSVFYVKSVDVYGMPKPLRTYKYEEVIETSPAPKEPEAPKDIYATKEDMDELKKMISDLKKNKDYKDKK